MNRDGLARAFFDERYVVPRADACREVRRVSRPGSLAAGLAGGPTSGHLVALLEAIAVREVLPFVDTLAEMVVATRVECRHRAPLCRSGKLHGWAGIGSTDGDSRLLGRVRSWIRDLLKCAEEQYFGRRP